MILSRTLLAKLISGDWIGRMNREATQYVTFDLQTDLLPTTLLLRVFRAGEKAIVRRLNVIIRTKLFTYL